MRSLAFCFNQAQLRNHLDEFDLKVKAQWSDLVFFQSCCLMGIRPQQQGLMIFDSGERIENSLSFGCMNSFLVKSTKASTTKGSDQRFTDDVFRK